MQLYVGDLDRKELINKIYMNYCKKHYDNIFMLDEKTLNNLEKMDFINNINNVELKIMFNNGYLSSLCPIDEFLISTVYKLKREKFLIVENALVSNAYNTIKENEKRINEIDTKIIENNAVLRYYFPVLDYNFYRMFANKNVIKVSDVSSNQYGIYLLWQENIKLSQERGQLTYDNMNIMQMLINGDNPVAIKKSS